MGGNAAAKEYPTQYFLASGLAATGCYPLWRSAAIGQSGFHVGTVKAGGITIPRTLAPYVQGFLPPYKGAFATVIGMTYARAAIFYLSDWGHDVMTKDFGCDEVTSTVIPPFVVSTVVQITNQPVVRATVTLQNPSYKHPNVWASVKHIYKTSGMSGLWHGTTAGVLKTVPKYCMAIAVKDYAERTLPKPDSTSSSSLECTTGLSLLESMVSYLRKEAVLADEKAKRLRKQAAEIAKEFGITDESQKLYEMDPAELAPLDEKGMPKYKGKKRGPKPKARKRKVKAGRQKRKHTGYTLFMQETYPKAKIENPDLPPKALISIMAKLWRNLAAGGKREWKERAETVNSDDTKDDSDWLCSVQTF